MDEMICPKCNGTMAERSVARVRVQQCESCQGVFLDRSELANLVEAENDWYAKGSADTAQLPRITPDMSAPPRAAKPRSYVDGLFQA